MNAVSSVWTCRMCGLVLEKVPSLPTIVSLQIDNIVMTGIDAYGSNPLILLFRVL